MSVIGPGIGSLPSIHCRHSSQTIHDLPLPSHLLNSSGKSQKYSQPAKSYNLFIVSWVCSRALFAKTCLKLSHLGGILRQIPEPPQLALLNAEENQLYSKCFPNDQTPHPVSKREPSPPRRKFIPDPRIRESTLIV